MNLFKSHNGRQELDKDDDDDGTKELRFPIKMVKIYEKAAESRFTYRDSQMKDENDAKRSEKVLINPRSAFKSHD